MTTYLVNPHLSLFLKLGSGFFWTLAYILILRRRSIALLRTQGENPWKRI